MAGLGDWKEWEEIGFSSLRKDREMEPLKFSSKKRPKKGLFSLFLG